MTRCPLWFLAALCLSSHCATAAAPPVDPPAKLSPEERERLEEERLNLLRRLERNEVRGLDNVIAAREKVATLEARLFPDQYLVRGVMLRILAADHTRVGNDARARELFAELKRLMEGALGNGHWEIREIELEMKYLDRLMKLSREERALMKKATELVLETQRQITTRGEIAENIEKLEECLALRKKVLGDDNHVSARTMSTLADLHGMTGRHNDARRLMERSLEVRIKEYGKEHPSVCRATLSLGILYFRMRRLERSQELLEQARVGVLKSLGAANAMNAYCVLNLGLVHQARGEMKQALDYFEQGRRLAAALPVVDFGPHSRGTVQLAVLQTLVAFHQEVKQIEKAAEVQEQVCQHILSGAGEKHEEYHAALKRLIALQQQAGQQDKAKASVQRLEAALKKSDRLSLPLDPDQFPGLTLLNLDQQLSATQDSARRAPILEEMCDVFKRLGRERSPRAIECAAMLCDAYRGVGQLQKALQLAERILPISEEVRGEKNQQHVTMLNNLAMLYGDAGKTDKAVETLERVVRLRRAARDTQTRRKLARNLSNLGGMYLRKGDRDTALRHKQEAIDIYRAIGAENTTDHAETLAGLSMLYAQTGEKEKAVRTAETVVALNKQLMGEEHHDVAVAQLYAMSAQVWAGDRKSALRLAQEAFYPVLRSFDHELKAVALSQRLSRLHNDRVYLHYFLSLAHEERLDPERTYEPVLRYRGLVGSRQADLWEALDHPDVQSVTRELRMARDRLVAVSLVEPTRDDKDELQARRGVALREKDRYERLVAQETVAALSLRTRPQVTTTALVAALPDNTALIDFVLYPHSLPKILDTAPALTDLRYVAFVMRKGRPVATVSLGNALKVEAAVAAWHRELKTRNGEPTPQTAGALRQLVWEPLQTHLKGCSQVLIVPDGSLALVPFAALPGSGKHRYLLEELAIGYLPSARHLLDSAGKPELPAHRSRGLLAVGGAAFGEGKTYKHLPGTEPESRHCAELFSKTFQNEPATLLLGKDASLERVRGEVAQRFRYLHFATHGFYQPERLQRAQTQGSPDGGWDFAMLRSGLALAGANSAGKGSGGTPPILLSEEIQGMDLRGTQLVVLSACQTGLGEATTGEGTLGLQRAFLLAGSKSVAATLWDVWDPAAVVLMEEFYRNLWEKKLPRLEALRQAQLTLLHNRRRVEERETTLLADLKKRGVSEDLLRGVTAGTFPANAPRGPADQPHSPVAWWAGFVLSGEWK